MLDQKVLLAGLLLLILSMKVQSSSPIRTDSDSFVQGLELAQLEMNQTIQDHTLRQQQDQLDALDFKRQETM